MRRLGMGTRRRGDELVHAIYEAALQEVGSSGYAKTTMEGIAHAAGTGKAALYRRWPDKDALLSDALRHIVPSFDDFRFHDELRTDLLAVYQRVREAVVSIKGDGRYAMIKADGGDELLHEVFVARVNRPGKALVLEILRRGAERGEVRPEAVTEMVAAAGYSLFIDRCKTQGMSVPEEYMEELVDNVVLPMVRT